MGQRTRLTADQRFAAKVLFMPDGCWLWQSYLTPDGYGTFWNGERRNGDSRSPITVLAHRWSYERFRGPVPDGLNVCHKCDVPPCVNPDHLFVDTQRGNVYDCIRKGRHRFGGNILTPNQEAEVRAVYQGTYGQLAELARCYETSSAVIQGIVRGTPRRYRITEAQKIEIRKRRAAGALFREIAEQLDIPATTVQRVAHGAPLP